MLWQHYQYLFSWFLSCSCQLYLLQHHEYLFSWFLSCSCQLYLLQHHECLFCWFLSCSCQFAIAQCCGGLFVWPFYCHVAVNTMSTCFTGRCHVAAVNDTYQSTTVCMNTGYSWGMVALQITVTYIMYALSVDCCVTADSWPMLSLLASRP